MNGWRDVPAEDCDARRAILWHELLKPRTVPVRRPTTELAREALDLYTGPASLIVKDFGSLARRPDWRPSPNQSAVILTIVARSGLRALDGESLGAQEGYGPLAAEAARR